MRSRIICSVKYWVISSACCRVKPSDSSFFACTKASVSILKGPRGVLKLLKVPDLPSTTLLTCANVSTMTALSTASLVALLVNLHRSTGRPGTCCCICLDRVSSSSSIDSRKVVGDLLSSLCAQKVFVPRFSMSTPEYLQELAVEVMLFRGSCTQFAEIRGFEEAKETTCTQV